MSRLSDRLLISKCESDSGSHEQQLSPLLILGPFALVGRLMCSRIAVYPALNNKGPRPKVGLSERDSNKVQVPCFGK